jgi:tripeptide aminopeptidase
VLEQIVDDIVSLVSIPAPTFSEQARIEWIRDRLADAPGTRVVDDVGNLIWSWGDQAPRLAVMAHVDTVFGKDVPLRTHIVGGRLHGPGVGDNAAGVAVGISVFEELLETTKLAPGAMVFTVCEEGLGNTRGAAAACAALHPEAVVALEGHGLEFVVVQVVGSLRARVRVAGPGGHSWVDRGQPSAVHALITASAKLLELAKDTSPINIGVVSGGSAVNAIAKDAEMIVEARSLDEDALLEFGETLNAMEVSSPLAISVEIIGRRHARATPESAALLQATKLVRSALDLPDAREPRTTDAAPALDLGIPALSLGVTSGAGMHTEHEWIDISSLQLGREQIRRLVLMLLGPESTHGNS